MDTDGTSSPRNDGTPGSALYRVPLILSVTPHRTWCERLVHHWDDPISYGTMHRRGIASGSGNIIILDGTTIEEIEQYYLAMLKLAVSAANSDRRIVAERIAAERRRQEEAARAAVSRLKFD